MLDNYNKIIKEIKDENNILKTEIIKLKEENSSLKLEISELKKLFQEYQSFRKQIYSIIDERIKYDNQKYNDEGNKVFYGLKYSSILDDNNERLYFQNLITYNV